MEPFLVARNPDPGSSLPYLVRLPIEGGLVLKTRESWPRANRAYCHPTRAVRASGGGGRVEDRYTSLFKAEHVEPGWLPELVARLQVRYPGVPIVFCDNLKFAEEWPIAF